MAPLRDFEKGGAIDFKKHPTPDIRHRSVNIPLAVLVVALSAALFLFAWHRIHIDTDIVGSLPTGDPVIADARYILEHHPIQDRVVIDVAVNPHDLDILIRAGATVEEQLKQSGRFRTVGTRKMQNLMPDLIRFVMDHLPVFFDAEELNRSVVPLLSPERVHETLNRALARLSGMDGIGQADWIAADPLELRNRVLARLSGLAPSEGIRFYQGQLLSPDGKHLLVVAEPEGSGTDTVFARHTTSLIRDIGRDLNERFGPKGMNITLTPVGAFRAALDNEQAARSDTQRTILFATIGIALLLFFAFPRPYIGLLSLVPAVAGTVMAFFVHSLFEPSISVLALGFGGAIISITVDHGIAYLLFLDRPEETQARDAARQVWSIGLLATLTTVGAFLTLGISGFPILAQVGRFTAMGIGFSFLFIHTVFPRVIPAMPPAKRVRKLPLEKIVDGLSRAGGRYKMWGALALALVMAGFAQPDFRVDLASLNTVSPETRAAEARITSVWGNLFTRVFMMAEAETMPQLQDKCDRLNELIEERLDTGVLGSGFVPSMLFPGKNLATANHAAWNRFWDEDRRNRLEQTLEKASMELGFSSHAFDSFLGLLENRDCPEITIPERFFGLAGISKKTDGKMYTMVSTLKPGPAYNAPDFYAACAPAAARVFDPRFFSVRLGDLLADTFLKMTGIIGLSVAVLVFLFFFDGILAMIALLPVGFAFVCTLGTLKLMGRPLDIPSLMLSIVVIGMGIDYAIFFVRSFQRYGNETHPGVGLIRMAVFLASASTLIGFGGMSMAEHALLKSAGVTSLIGIGYALIGSFAILPPLLNDVFRPSPYLETPAIGPKSVQHRAILKRYRHLEAVPRITARYRLRFDPLFSELEQVLKSAPRIILDVGTGIGLHAAWILTRFSDVRITGMEPDPENARIASRIIGERGVVTAIKISDIPHMETPPDTILMIDILAYLSDDQLKRTLENIYQMSYPGVRLLIRQRAPNPKPGGAMNRISGIIDKISGKRTPVYRLPRDIQNRVADAGFNIESLEHHSSSMWLIARKTIT